MISTPGPEVLKAWLEFGAALAWPLTTLVLLLAYRGELIRLLNRIRSGEIAGARFDFNEAATGFIKASVDSLADEQDFSKRKRIAREVKDIASMLGGLHPIALGLLINAASGTHSWVGGAYRDKSEHFDAVVGDGLAELTMMPDREGEEAAVLRLTAKGYDLLRSIGFSDHELRY